MHCAPLFANGSINFSKDTQTKWKGVQYLKFWLSFAANVFCICCVCIVEKCLMFCIFIESALYNYVSRVFSLCMCRFQIMLCVALICHRTWLASICCPPNPWSSQNPVLKFLVDMHRQVDWRSGYVKSDHWTDTDLFSMYVIDGNHQVQSVAKQSTSRIIFSPSLKEEGLNAVRLFNFPGKLKEVDNMKGYKAHHVAQSYSKLESVLKAAQTENLCAVQM